MIKLVESVDINHVTSLGVDDARKGVVLEGDLGFDTREVLTESELNPRHVFDGRIPTSLVSVSGVGDDLDLHAVFIPLFVESLQLCLEGLAATSPVSGVEDHDDRAALEGLLACDRLLKLKF